MTPLSANPDQIEVWLVDLDESDEDTIASPPIEEAFGHILNSEEMSRAKRLIRPRDRIRFARCRSAVRSIMGRIQNIPPAAVCFGTGRYGKPFLEPSSGAESPSVVEFNVSHSGGFALVAASSRRPVGVDLEHIRPIGEAERIVSSFFTDTEKSQFAAIDPDNRQEAFMRGWTRKEAILKGTGMGLVGGASRYESMFGISPLSAEFQPATPSPLVAGWMLWEARIAEGYVATLAVATDSLSELDHTTSSS